MAIIHYKKMREIGVGSGVHYSTVQCGTCHVVPVVPGTRTTRQHIFITRVYTTVVYGCR